jgi:hypothetical protein
MSRLLCRQGLAEGKLGFLARKGSRRLPKGFERLVHQEGFVVSAICYNSDFA